jgi:hypothetical protein
VCRTADFGRRACALVCTLYDVRQSLFRVAVAQNFGATTSITEGFTGDLDPSILPSNHRLVFIFSSSRAGNRNLWTSGLDGSGAPPLTSGASLDERPSISPDGRQIAVVSDREGRRALWLINPESGRRHTSEAGGRRRYRWTGGVARRVPDHVRRVGSWAVARFVGHDGCRRSHATDRHL